MFIYTCASYKEILRDGILRPDRMPNKQNLIHAKGSKLTFQKMAEFCGVQKTYLSKVINHDAHLSTDQLYLALMYLGLEEDAREYSFLLYELERTQVNERRELFRKKIREIRNEKLKTEAHIDLKADVVSDEKLAPYFLDPLFQ